MVQRLDGDLWLADTSTGVFSRLTLDPPTHVDPEWSPDSRQIVYSQWREGGSDLMEMDVGAGTPRKLYSDNKTLVLDDWSPDGRFIVGHVFIDPADEYTRAVFLFPLEGDRKPKFVLRGPFVYDQFHVSPDSRWVAYESTESGRFEVFVGSFPDFRVKRQVSSQGGGEPLWRQDGKELFYLNPEGKLMSAAVSAGTTLQIGESKVLFQSPLTSPSMEVNEYWANHDGQKFLFVAPQTPAGANEPINVVVSWDANLPK